MWPGALSAKDTCIFLRKSALANFTKHMSPLKKERKAQSEENKCHDLSGGKRSPWHGLLHGREPSMRALIWPDS